MLAAVIGLAIVVLALVITALVFNQDIHDLTSRVRNLEYDDVSYRHLVHADHPRMRLIEQRVPKTNLSIRDRITLAEEDLYENKQFVEVYVTYNGDDQTIDKFAADDVAYDDKLRSAWVRAEDRIALWGSLVPTISDPVKR